MIRDCKPDGLALLVRPESACTALMRVCLAHGMPFMVEKPPTPDAATHRELIQAVGDLTHIVAYNRRHAPYITQARTWMQGEDLQCVTAMFTRHRRREHDFTTTAVHAIDTARFLAGDDLVALDLSLHHTGEACNFFLNGWTADNIRVDILITPDTASAVEHYILRGTQRTVIARFPHPSLMDVPGGVEYHEENQMVQRLTHADFDCTPDDLPGLGGVRGEHEVFIKALNGEAVPGATLAATLQTQIIREELGRMITRGETRSRVCFE